MLPRLCSACSARRSRRAARFPPRFLTTQNSFTTGIANPANFNPLDSNVDYIPANSPWPYDSELVPVGAAATHQEHRARDCLQRQSQLSICRSSPTTIRPTPNAAGRDSDVPAARARSDVRSHHMGRSGRQRSLQRAFGARWSIVSAGGLYFLNSFTWGEGDRRFRAGAGILRRLRRGQSAEHPRPGRRSTAPPAST